MAEIISLADYKRPVPASPDPETEEALILRRIQQIADNRGIDVEAPFRSKGGDD